MNEGRGSQCLPRRLLNGVSKPGRTAGTVGRPPDAIRRLLEDLVVTHDLGLALSFENIRRELELT